MEEKDGIVYGSSGNSETDSPPVSDGLMLPEVRDMEIDLGGATSTPGSNGGGDSEVFGKKRRGRPRKDDDGDLRFNDSVTPQSDFSSPREFSSKRGRGRPKGSGNWQLLASLGEIFANTAGGDFTPHVVTVNSGEDVAGKIISLAKLGPRGICVLSANGAVSNVTIRQPGSSGGILTYEGRFEILSLSGSFTVTDTGGVRSKTGGLSVSLAGPDGRVIGGGVAGLLMASNPIQVVVGSFMPNGYKAHKRKLQREHSSATISAAPAPISQAKPDDETCLVGVSAALPDVDANNTPNATLSLGARWNESSVQRPYPDINLCVPVE